MDIYDFGFIERINDEQKDRGIHEQKDDRTNGDG